jgi:ribulose-5-phosphate 4-epimerase/fuculose-1-phosphate aldolase
MTNAQMLDRGQLDDQTHEALKPPAFATVAEERAHRKARLAGACRIFARFGYDHWVAGHLTARDPEHGDRFWVNPLGVSWRRIRVSDLLLVDFDGRVVEGERPVNAAAFAIHSEIHRSREDAVAAAHAHTPYGRAWSATGRPLEPISQDHCAFYGDHAVFSDFTGAVYDTAESRRFATAIGRGKALILQNHGLLTVGQSVDEAAFWLHLLERCAQTMLLVNGLAPNGGRPAYTVLSHEVASHTREQVGEPLHGWRGFQPLWDELIAEQEDFLS